MSKKYYKLAFLIGAVVLLIFFGRILWIKFFYYKFGALPVPDFTEPDKFDVKYINQAFFSAKPDENSEYKKCRVYLVNQQVLSFDTLKNALNKIGIGILLDTAHKMVSTYKFNTSSFEGVLYRYKDGVFVDILLVRGNRGEFINKLNQALGPQINFAKESKNSIDLPIIDTEITPRIDKGMSQMIRVKLTVYEVLDSTLYKCLNLKDALLEARSGKIPYGQLVQLTKISLRTANIPALEGGVNVVTDNTYPSPFVLEDVKKVFLAVPVDKSGHNSYLYPAYLLSFKSEGTVKSRVGEAYLAREGRVVLPAIAPDWYNK